jgi:glyoxylase-like metal-dependent hydrolase (beta-lactamase superfamily II)
VQQVYKNIYRLDIPLIGSPLKLLHSYLIRGEKRNLLIDTGFNHDSCQQAMLDAFARLGAVWDNTDIFLTHLHADHTGLAGRLKNENNIIYCSEKDGYYLNQSDEHFNARLLAESSMFGISADKVLHYISHPGIKFKSGVLKYKPLEEHDCLPVGDYCFEAVDLSGHTPGQLGLYEARHKIMFCGDHILCDITPNIVIWENNRDSIQVFRENLEKVRSMDIAYLFSGHRSQVTDYKTRIDELICHHNRRLAEVMQILAAGEKTVYDIADKMSWDYCGGIFANFPPEQVWFATSEAYAHIEHLFRKGKLVRKEQQGKYIYGLA